MPSCEQFTYHKDEFDIKKYLIGRRDAFELDVDLIGQGHKSDFIIQYHTVRPYYQDEFMNKTYHRFVKFWKFAERLCRVSFC